MFFTFLVYMAALYLAGLEQTLLARRSIFWHLRGLQHHPINNGFVKEFYFTLLSARHYLFLQGF